MATILLMAVQARAQFPLGFGDTENDRGNAVLGDGSGGVFVTGVFRGKTDFDPDEHLVDFKTSKGDHDVFVARYDATGALVWVIAFGGTSYDEGLGLASDGKGGFFVTGSFGGTVDFDPDEAKTVSKTANGQAIFLAHFDQNGTFIDVIDIGNANLNAGRGLASDGGTGVFLTGYFHGEKVDFDPGAGTTDHMHSMFDRAAFLAYYTGGLDLIWAVPIVTGKPTEAAAVAADGEGGAYITGHFKGTARFDPDTPADTTASTEGETDAFLARYDQFGKYVWAFNIKGGGIDYGRGVAADAQGVTMVGSMDNGGFKFDPNGTFAIQTQNQDAFVARYDKNKAFQWAFSIDGADATVAHGITYDGSGGIIVTGGFIGVDTDFDPVGEKKIGTNGAGDVFIARYKTDKSLDWVATVGGSEGDEGSAVAVSGGNAFYTGHFTGKADFDPDIPNEKKLHLESKGGQDGFVAGQSLGGGLVYSCAPSGSLIPVLNSSDSAPCSFRRALVEANAKPNADISTPDVIVFNIKPGGAKSVELQSALPSITEAVVIDGNSQPGCTGPCIGLVGVLAGTSAGVKITSAGSTVQGLSLTLFQGPGVHITGTAAKNNVIRGSHIGVALDGTTSGGNLQGVLVDAGAADNVIGGTLSGDPNIISSNSGPGITVLNAGNGNRIEGNLIGVDLSGTKALPNTIIGVLIESTNETVVGGTLPSAGNLISGHNFNFDAAGVFLKAANGTRIEGNLIGTDGSGMLAIPNYTGVWVESGAADNVIGGSVPGASNLISGNAAHGIRLFSAGQNNSVQANRIGWNLTGDDTISGQPYGIFLTGTANTLIGGVQAGAGNQIAGQGTSGIYIGDGGTQTAIQGNFIGSPVLEIGNPTKHGNNVGIFIHEGATNNLIGGLFGVSTAGPCTGACNTIHNNKGNGVVVAVTLEHIKETAGNAIRGNSLLGNGLLGIDLGQDGVTAQDADDSDLGPNGLMNYPMITSAIVNTTTSTISIEGDIIGGAPGVDLDFYINPECDATGYGEGAAYVGSMSVTVSNLIESFQTSFSVPADLPQGVVLTATAKGTDGSTSEFSKCFTPGFKKSMKLTLKGNLQGPWKHLGGMTNLLNLDLQPASPYGPDPTPIGPDPTPFIDGDGNGRVDFFEQHPDLVDWILVKLLSGDPKRPPMQLLSGRSVFIAMDGSFVDLNGSRQIVMPLNANPTRVDDGTAPPDDGVTRGAEFTCYIAVNHRNHIGVMSPPLDCSGGELHFDFATGEAFGEDPMAHLGAGLFGLFAGDANGDGVIDDGDLAAWQRKAGVSGYDGADLNLDGNVFNDDLLQFWRPNLAKSAQVPEH